MCTAVGRKAQMKTEILKLLRETDGYVSGQQISERFGVSRTAVWKAVRQLQEEGYQVEAVRQQRVPYRGQPGYNDKGRAGQPDDDRMGGEDYPLL